MLTIKQLLDANLVLNAEAVARRCSVKNVLYERNIGPHN